MTIMTPKKAMPGLQLEVIFNKRQYLCVESDTTSTSNAARPT